MDIPPIYAPIYWLAGAALLWSGLHWFEHSCIYAPSREMIAHPGSYGFPYEELTLKALDGPLINAWYVPNKPDSPVILLCHGNGGNISSRLEKLAILRKAGASVLLFDYRGYGRSAGNPSEQGTYRDAEAAYGWLTRIKNTAPERIFFHGESLGVGVAVEMALRHKPAGLIAESGFTSIVDMAGMVFPYLPGRLLVRFNYDNLSKISRVACPVLVMHSPQDDIIPYAMGRRLFEAAPQPKSFFELKGDHNEGFLDAGSGYGEAIGRFLAYRS